MSARSSRAELGADLYQAGLDGRGETLSIEEAARKAHCHVATLRRELLRRGEDRRLRRGKGPREVVLTAEGARRRVELAIGLLELYPRRRLPIVKAARIARCDPEAVRYGLLHQGVRKCVLNAEAVGA